MSKRAIVVVDIQNEYFADGKLLLAGIEQAAQVHATIMAALAFAYGTVTTTEAHLGQSR